jgi:hypothetical protein
MKHYCYLVSLCMSHTQVSRNESEKTFVNVFVCGKYSSSCFVSACIFQRFSANICLGHVRTVARMLKLPVDTKFDVL